MSRFVQQMFRTRLSLPRTSRNEAFVPYMWKNIRSGYHTAMLRRDLGGKREWTSEGSQSSCTMKGALSTQQRGFSSKREESRHQNASHEEEELNRIPPLSEWTFQMWLGVGWQLVKVAGIATIVGTCGYFIVAELFPTRMSPNGCFNEATEEIRKDDRIRNMLGYPIKVYGQETGGGKEGRRTHITHKSYAATDGSKRLRIRFNAQGMRGKAAVFAEVSNRQKKGEWVYLIVQHSQTGQTVPIYDNRTMVDIPSAPRPTSDDPFDQLMYGGDGDESDRWR